MFVVASASFRLLYVMIILGHPRRKIVRTAVTDHPVRLTRSEGRIYFLRRNDKSRMRSKRGPPILGSKCGGWSFGEAQVSPFDADQGSNGMPIHIQNDYLS